MLAVCAAGVASADSISYLSTPITFGPQATDFTYSLALPRFDTSLVPAGAILSSAKIYFYAQENITTLTLTNQSSDTNTFTFTATSNATKNSTNSANQADSFGANGPEGLDQVVTLFSQTMTLGGVPLNAAVCPTGTPSGSCNSVTFADTSNSVPSIASNNLSLTPSFLFPTGTGDQGLTGVVMTITGADLLNYIGNTSFSLGGSTLSSTTFTGGGNNVSPAINTTAQFAAEIDYTYFIPSNTPEPATMALMGGALLGLGLLRRRFSRS
jgi:hypothetical protein